MTSRMVFFVLLPLPQLTSDDDLLPLIPREALAAEGLRDHDATANEKDPSRDSGSASLRSISKDAKYVINPSSKNWLSSLQASMPPGFYLRIVFESRGIPADGLWNPLEFLEISYIQDP